MSRVLLAGAFGQHNPGDEGLLAAFAGALADHDVVVATSDPGDTRARHSLEAIERHDAAAVARETARAEAVVFAGGTIFKRLHPSSGRRPLELLRRARALALATRALGKTLALVGVGAADVGPGSGRWLARGLVASSDLLILRDEESADLLADAGAPAPFRVGADPAWALLGQEDFERDGHAAGGPVVVALSHLAAEGGLDAWLATALAPLASAGLALRLQPWQVLDGSGAASALDDAALAQATLARLGGDVAILPPPADLLEAAATFSEARLVIGMRMHSLVAAGAAGTPFVAVAHEPKLEGMARRLDQPAVTLPAPPERIGEVALAALEHPVPPARDAVLAETEAAEEGFRLLRLLLAKGATPDAEAVTGLDLRPKGWVG